MDRVVSVEILWLLVQESSKVCFIILFVFEKDSIFMKYLENLDSGFKNGTFIFNGNYKRK